jgi:hypothetical protein
MENHQPMNQVKSNFYLQKKDDLNSILLDEKSEETNGDSSSFSVEYARSNRSTCQGCKSRIDKDLVRLSQKVVANHGNAPTDQWYHIDCFKEQKDELHFNGTAETFVDFCLKLFH